MKTQALADCPQCQGIGWLVEKETQISTVRRCPSCQSELQKKRLLAAAQIPRRYLDKGFDAYSPRNKSQESALKTSIQLVENYPRIQQGLLMMGPCGVGKTHLAAAVLKALVVEKQIAARFVDETELLRRLQYSYGPGAPETEREVLLPLMHCDLLVWDDLGTGRPTEWVRETVHTIINFRYTSSKLCVFTTNRTLPGPRLPARGIGLAAPDVRRAGSPGDHDLAERIGQHLYSRIREMCKVLELGGPDARLEKHETRLDFQAPIRPVPPITIPGKLIRCQKCDSRDVTQQDFSQPIESSSGKYREVSCHCRNCQQVFVARYFPQTAKVEYPETG